MQEGSKGSLTVIRCDLRNQGDITSMFERIRSEFGALHICVNSAGLSKNAPLLSGDTDDWREMLDVSVENKWLYACSSFDYTILSCDYSTSENVCR